MVTPLWPQRDWFTDHLALITFLLSPLHLHAVEPAITALCEKVSQKAGVAMASCLETVEQLIRKAGFSKEVVEVALTDIISLQHAYIRESGLDISIGVIKEYCSM